jgi:hypothetical protein
VARPRPVHDCGASAQAGSVLKFGTISANRRWGVESMRLIAAWLNRICGQFGTLMFLNPCRKVLRSGNTICHRFAVPRTSTLES